MALSELVSRRELSRREFLKGLGLATGAMILGGSTPLRGEEPIKLGALGPVEIFVGEGIQYGAQLAVEEINARGGLLGGRPLELIIRDTEQKPDVGLEAVQELVLTQKVDSLVGLFRSEVVVAISQQIHRFGIPLLITGATEPAPTRLVAEDYKKFKYIFRVMLNGGFLATNLLEFCKEFLLGKLLVGGVLPNNRVAIVAEDLIWTVPIADRLKALLPQMGFEVVGEPIRIALGTTDFSPILADIEGKDAAATITIFSDPTMVPFVAEWARGQIPTALFGINAPFHDPETCQAIGGLAEGMVEMEVTGGRAEILGKTIPFYDAYLERFGKEPVYTSFITYDAVHLLAEAIERAGTTDPDAVVSALEETDWVGASGRIQFYTDPEELAHVRETLNPYVGPHDAKYGREFIYPVQVEFQAGCKKVVIWPEDRKTGEYGLPPWMIKK